ncbi:MAG: M23 family metallopeptidase [Chloroflexi bacterium]|nr:MAG: M23 family metallopeptidase [Chloroflexota bacterium]TMC30241.1 MAG: M23 family metallopeptidase [Chloroflexota bacterium]TMC33385.1 MAG: M23 family metallopeptidase [Chloroflexota bacterium]TME43404.1 MAG: M23 family metallopeptidase [Chloroflexota bacterium]
MEDGVDPRMKLLRALVLIAIIAGGGAYAYQLRTTQSNVAVAAPVRYKPDAAVERYPAAALDVREHGRGPVVPAAALTGFALPVGYQMPEETELLPGSPREYRGGYHEGVDFPLSMGMPVAAAKAGKIIRIDSDYTEWSVEEQINGEDVGFRLGYTPETILDKLRGRQIWIDHGYGIVTRYAHLSSVELFSVGSIVEQGTIIGHVGNSGTKAGPHLHIEIRVGEGYLGDGLSGAELLRVLRHAFSVG